jgi:hypothetical protein
MTNGGSVHSASRSSPKSKAPGAGMPLHEPVPFTQVVVLADVPILSNRNMMGFSGLLPTSVDSAGPIVRQAPQSDPCPA